jgi:Arc/MetJ-type ribon-helix-helix transcriptional regulator
MPRLLHRTTIAIPGQLLTAVDHAVRAGRAANRNQFILTAIEAEIRRQRRAALDAEFALMAADGELQSESAQLMREFDAADRESSAMLPKSQP